MDPNELLDNLRQGVGDMHENFADLDEWLTSGGFPPQQWPCRDIDAETRQAAHTALAALDAAADGDSNDREIEAGREVADILAALVGYTSDN